MTVAETQVELPRLVVGEAFTLGELSEGRIMCLASACPAGSTDPVDLAVAEALQNAYPALPVLEVDSADVDPASLSRRYSLTRVRDVPAKDGDGTEDLVVMRGDLDSVIKATKARHEPRGVIKRNADVVTRRGWRPLAVAVAPVDENDVIGEYKLQGFVTVSPKSVHAALDDVASGPAIWARVNVWSGSLRLQHWANVVIIFTLSCTGYLIMDPFIGPQAAGREPTGYLMGGIRFIHFTAAFLWLVVGAARILSATMSRDRYLRWPTMWPLKSKDDVRNLGKIVQHYAFIKEDAPLYLAHNPLQQLTYTSVYIACGLQLVAGFVLFGLYDPNNWFWSLVSTPAYWVGIANVRSFHTGMMFALWAFVIAHVYLAFRAESMERHGGLGAMISGAVWMRRGSHPVDAPGLE